MSADDTPTKSPLPRLVDAMPGAPAADCYVCGIDTYLRLPVGDGVAPICSEECRRAFQRVRSLHLALVEARSVLALCTTRDFDAPEDEEVRRLGERIGYGAVMSAASKTWASKAKRERLDGSQHTCGPCELTVTRTLETIDAALKGVESDG